MGIMVIFAVIPLKILENVHNSLNIIFFSHLPVERCASVSA